MPHLVRAAAQLGPLPSWVERYPLTAMSPDARQLAWAVGRRITGNPDHGFRIAARVPAEAVGSLWTLYRAAPDLAAIHRRYPEFSALLLECMLPGIELSANSVRLRLQRGSLRSVDRAEEDFRAAMQVKTWRGLLQRPDFAPTAVHFTYARPRSTSMHRQMLGTCTLHFEQAAFGFELPKSAWKERLPGADPERFEQLCALAREQARALRETQHAVEDRVIERLAQGPVAKSVALALGVSERTLRRRLAGIGDSFRKVVERARRRESELLDGVREVGGARAVSRYQLAQLLGFANPGALRNARRRDSQVHPPRGE
jgi:AraC-like DNA-binding protein